MNVLVLAAGYGTRLYPLIKDTPKPLLESLNEKEDIIVVGGDNLFYFDIQKFISFAHGKSPAITIGVYDIHDKEGAKKFGVVEADKSGKIVSFEEKPPNPRSTLIAMCFYYFPKNSLGNVGQY